MSNLLPYRKEKKYLPHELLQMYRRRAALTQTELAALVGLQSRRMIPAWEAGESLPKPDRLEKLLEVYLNRGVFVSEREVEEARQLWQTVKSFYDANSERLAAYPVFDDAWFGQILTSYRTGATPPAVSVLPLAQPAPDAILTPPNSYLSTALQTNLLIGREREILEVGNLLREPNVRLLTLTGPGGTGKTRLSMQVAAEMETEFGDGSKFVRLETARDRQAVIAAIAQTLGVKELMLTAPTPDTLWPRLKEFLATRQLLLVLDNFEQVVAAGSVVTELLGAANGLKILVTSREVLHLYGEQEYAVPPLELPPALDSSQWEGLAHYAAIQLFIERARLVQPDFVLNAQNGPMVAEICRRLDGLPLAIELAAGRLKLFSPASLLERLSTAATSGSVLSGGARDLPGRHQTLRNTLEWSYKLLEVAEQRLFRWLSVFVVGVTLTALETVYQGDSESSLLELVSSLIDKSLLRQVPGDGTVGEARFKQLETVREYALEQLEASPDAYAAHHQHALYYLALAKKAEPLLYGEGQVEWLARLELEHDNLRAALDWALQGEAAQLGLGLQLAGVLWLFWSTHGHISEGRVRLTLALEGARTGGTGKYFRVCSRFERGGSSGACAGRLRLGATTLSRKSGDFPAAGQPGWGGGFAQQFGDFDYTTR